MAHFICKKCRNSIYYSIVDPDYRLSRMEQTHAVNCLGEPLPSETLVVPRVPRLVVIESPYASGATENKAVDVAANREYLQRCIRDSILRGEAPFASHQMYTEALDDLDPGERAQGMNAGFAWARAASAAHVVYRDRGVSPGMQMAIKAALSEGREVEYRHLHEELYERCLHISLSSACAVGRFHCRGCHMEWTGFATVPSDYDTWADYMISYSSRILAPKLLSDFYRLVSQGLPDHEAAHIALDEL